MEMGGKISFVEGLLHTLLEFCQRNSTSVDESERQVIGIEWFLHLIIIW